VDKYIGDGVMLRFNVPRPIAGDHAAQAVEAACEMCRDFAALKEGWRTFALPVEPLFARVGIACGPVHEAVVGHPQYQQVTVLGDAVNRAANLCESAPRDRNTVLLDDEVSARVGSAFALSEVAADDGHGKPLGAREIAQA
jgi:class 3 adenylate cyclase